LLLSIICFVLLPFLGLAAVLGFAAAAPRSQLLGRTLVRGDGRTPRIALTFDDGPGEATPLILDILKKAGIRATFFLCGQNVERFPEHARRIAAEGHEVGNHTYSHPYLVCKTPGGIAWEIARAQNVIGHSTGCRPKLFRPPYGVRWFGLFPVLASHELTAVMWSVSGVDWRLPAARIADRVIAKAKPGSIILLHDGVPPGERGDRRETAEALQEIVRALGKRYRFATASEMV
jgi:peptidoglycan/xylan/chitin deacetylase (PgdA/CDA1 family)